ncbi:uncharacterized protein LOC143182051 [Calliopsis andreniformis]|uniref:uncharacterized protein LOC143182051 n=1 Tax=Calliopsis andreniformis TaxID=337506 RepID=UPI003FCEB061
MVKDGKALLLIALPMCLAQYTVVGPSDGNRVAQGFTVKEGKGIQYTEQNDSPGQSYIQGATAGYATVQGPSDGHSDFAIQGASADPANYVSRAAAEPEYAAYNPNEKALNYNDDSGFKLNWKSYDRPSRLQPEAQYAEAPVAVSAPRAQPQRHRGHVHAQPRPQPRPQPQPQPQPQQQPEQVQPINLDAAPAYIKDLIRYQLQLPYYNNFLTPVSYESGASQGDSQEQAPEPRRPAYRGKQRGQSRQKRQAQRQSPKAAPQPEPPGVPIQYHNQLPTVLQQLVQAQDRIPYINVIPEPFRKNLTWGDSRVVTIIRNFCISSQARAKTVLFRYNPDYQAQREHIQSYFRNLKVDPRPPPLETSLQSRQGPEPKQQHRQKRQAPHPQPQPAPAEPQIHYSTNIPGHLRELLKFQAEIPYNIPNQLPYNFAAPLVPQPAQAPQQVQYQGQGNAYQGQPSGQDNQPQYQPQYQSQIQQYRQPGGDIRPVTENQY